MLVTIFGPTAVGKSRVAVAVAEALNGEIVSADSMQVYDGLTILTDQPGSLLLSKVPHHLVGHVRLNEEYSAARYAEEAEQVIGKLMQRDVTPVIVGGTGLYIRAVTGGLDFPGQPREERRAYWQRLVDDEGVESAYRELLAMDPQAAASIDASNPRRVIRALEIAENRDVDELSASRREKEDSKDRLWSSDSPYHVCSFGLDIDRDQLYRRIDERVRQMLELGVVEEVRRARDVGVSRTAAQAIGFASICEYLDGKIDIDQAADAIRQASRQYAKRQLTWMRKMPDIARIDVTGSTMDAAVEAIIERVRSC